MSSFSTLKLIAWDDYCGVLAPTDEPDPDVFDADASSDEEAADSGSPALRAAATPTFTLASYSSIPARASTTDLYRAINIPTFALVRRSPRKRLQPPRSPQRLSRLHDGASSRLKAAMNAKVDVNTSHDVDSNAQTDTDKRANAHAFAPNPCDMPTRKPKVDKLTRAKKRRMKVDSPLTKHATHAPKRRPLQAKVPNAA
ncbi:hypothetical protein CspeluHIS016_0203780 [Cutaneotrichosporon spelunceum]|uniref:Uncharacterized protein n=1 Tax=Cutaneotrichosporon spelunceum TaxID=1672016 RepID=A0AAD3TR46_9TREE|nr:hypothetical protein CspeluHIS016_0203780 [Cutaneotrichosporon spelunceum]